MLGPFYDPAKDGDYDAWVNRCLQEAENVPCWSHEDVMAMVEEIIQQKERAAVQEGRQSGYQGGTIREPSKSPAPPVELLVAASDTGRCWVVRAAPMPADTFTTQELTYLATGQRMLAS